MITARAPLPVFVVPFAAVLALAGCASGSPDTPAAVEETAVAPATDPATTDTASGDSYGCTDAMLAYMADNGYPDATPADPAGFTFEDGISITAVPDCYVVDDVGGFERSGAVFVGDTEAVIGEIGGALAAAGYTQSDDFGPYVWWLGGDDPVQAEHALTAAPQPIDGADAVWATW